MSMRYYRDLLGAGNQGINKKRGFSQNSRGLRKEDMITTAIH